MNRAMRRDSARRKATPKGWPKTWPKYHRTRALPHEVDLVFYDIDRFFRQLSEGLVDVDQQGRLVFQTLYGEKYETIPAVLGFMSVWRRISDKFHLKIDVFPVEKLCKRLEVCMPITPGEVEECKAIILTMRRAYAKLDLYDVKSVVNTELISLELTQPGANQ